MYSITPSRGPCKGVEVFYGKVWIRSEHRRRHFLLGPGFIQAKKRLAAIYSDPERVLAERELRKSQSKLRALTFGFLLDEFLKTYRSRGGTAYYQGITRAPRAFFGEKPVPEITVPELDRYLAARRAEKTNPVERALNGVKTIVAPSRRRVSESTLRKEVIALGTVFRWAERRGLVGRNPIARLEKPKEPSRHGIAILDVDQEEKLLAACPPWARDVVEWTLYSGMRRGEVLALRSRDIDRPRGVVHVLGTKTGKTRTVPLALSGRLDAILARHPRRTDTDLVFRETNGAPLDVDVLNGVLEAAAQAAGIPKERGVLWNRLRHTWATRLAASGKASIFEIAKMMGNSAAICERHYAAYVPGAHERLTGALDGPAPERELSAGRSPVGDQVTPEAEGAA
jgi:integrase